MMKLFITIIFTVIVFLLQNNPLYSQCVPGNYTKPNIYPDTLINLDTAFAGQPYQMIMTAVIPVDTLVLGNRLPVDSIGIVSLTGLPSSLTYQADKASGYWKGGTKGCILISGTPTNAEAGIYPLNITVNAVVAGLPAFYPVKGYKLIVNGNSSFAFENAITNIKLYPNPFYENASLRFFSNFIGPCHLSIFNSFGQEVYKKEIVTSQGYNSIVIQKNNLKDGIYILKLHNSEGLVSLIFSIK